MQDRDQREETSAKLTPRPPSLSRRIRRFIFGAPVASDHMAHTLLPKFLAFAFAVMADPVSSVAYATQQIILALGAAGLWLAEERVS